MPNQSFPDKWNVMKGKMVERVEYGEKWRKLRPYPS